MGTIRDSWGLTTTSLRMVREDLALLALPAIAGAALFGLLLLFTLPLVALYLANPSGVFAWMSSSTGEGVLVLLYVVLYFALAFVGNFFFAALIGAAMMKLEGGQPTVMDGIRFARRKIVRIFVWSAISATIGLLIRAISQRVGGLAGALIGFGAGATWSVATYFAIPVIVYEDQGAWASLKRSAGLFVQTFGRTILSNLFVGLIAIGLGIGGFILLVAGVYLLFGGAVLVGISLVLCAVAVWIFAAVLITALEGILRAALYRYATTGKISADVIPYEYRQRGTPLP